LSANKALEKDPLVDAAKNAGSALAETYVTEPAVDVERVDVVFEF
jgi:hypothetical protein